MRVNEGPPIERRLLFVANRPIHFKSYKRGAHFMTKPLILAVALTAATALIGQCSQASGPPVCVRYAPAVAPLALAALAIVAAVMAVRPSRHARR